jgi:hypothetical protein
MVAKEAHGLVTHSCSFEREYGSTWPRQSNNVQNVPPVGAGEILGRLRQASLKCSPSQKRSTSHLSQAFREPSQK